MKPPAELLQSARGRGATITDGAGRSCLDFDLHGGLALDGHRAFAGAGEIPEREPLSPERIETLQKTAMARFRSAGACRFHPSRHRAIESVCEKARIATGRGEVLRFRGSRHGFFDEPALAAAGAVRRTIAFAAPRPDARGQRFFKFNEIATIENYIESNAGSVAAVLVDPLPVTMSLVIPGPGFLQRLQTVCTKNGVITIADEGNTGFRFGPAGAARRLGFEPDITIYGEGATAGLPMGVAVIHNENLVDDGVATVAPGSASPAGLLAFAAALESSASPDHPRKIDTLGAQLARGLELAAAGLEPPPEIVRFGSCVSLVFARAGIIDPALAARYDAERHAAWRAAMAMRAVHIPEHPWSPLFVGNCHVRDDVDYCISAAHDAFSEMEVDSKSDADT